MPARTHARRKYRRIATVFLVLVFCVILIRQFTSSEIETYELSTEIARNENNVGRKLAETELTTVDNKKFLTTTLLGSPIIINVWYSTCEPCRRELPVLAAGAKTYDGQVRFIGVNIKDSAEIAIQFAKKYGVAFEIFLDRDGQFISKSGISTAPVTLAVSPEGLIVGQIAGELSTKSLDDLVAVLLK